MLPIEEMLAIEKREHEATRRKLYDAERESETLRRRVRALEGDARYRDGMDRFDV